MKTKDGRHKFKWRIYDGRKVRIDEELAPILDKMWKLGIRTTNCCQQHCSFACGHKHNVKKMKDGSEYFKVIRTKRCGKDVWIVFESCKDVERLYNIVAEYDSSYNDETMYNKMSAGRFIQTGATKYRSSIEGWAFSFFMNNHGVEGHWGRPTFNGKRSTREMWIDDGCEKNDFVIQPQITFPRKHLKYVEQRLTLALSNRKSYE
jgi:hypothetical protein